MPFQKGHKFSPKRKKDPIEVVSEPSKTPISPMTEGVPVPPQNQGLDDGGTHPPSLLGGRASPLSSTIESIAAPAVCQPCSKCTKRRAKAGLEPLYCYDCDLCSECFSVSVIVTDEDGKRRAPYTPQPHQIVAHACDAPNLLCLGTRGTGKSKWLRWDAIIRCMMIPNFRALIIRRTMPELRKSHLSMIEWEMKQLGGHFLKTTFQAVFPNGSTITFAHCETEADILNFLSSEYGFIGFDELSTFTLNQFLQISAAARAPEGEGYDAVVRCGSNPLGVGSLWMKAWFVDHQVRCEDYPDYLPDEFVMQFSTLDDNEYLDKKKYESRLKNLPDHVRRAWLKGEFVNEGTYFEDFFPSMLVGDTDGEEVELPWHVIDDVPRWQGMPIFSLSWLSIYRAVDWGYSPDPAVCLWIAVLPNKSAIVFKEMTWKKTLAENVAKDIKKASEGMHVVETFCLPLDAPVWMGDFTFKPLSEVKVGDEVVSGPQKNWKTESPNKHRYLQKATVTQVHRTRKDVVKVTMVSGKVLYCTPDHKWLSGRSLQERWVEPEVGRKFCHVVDIPGPCPDKDKAAWLGGIYDGEGCRCMIAQSRDHNPQVYTQIDQYLRDLGFSTTAVYKRTRPAGVGAYESGVRFSSSLQSATNFVNWVPSLRFRAKYAARHILISKYRTYDEVAKIESCGVQDVGCITTTTGNFVAYGYMTSNCDPTMFIETGASMYSIADKFESNGVPLTASVNDREMFGYSINEFLTERVNWGTDDRTISRPKLQIVKAEGKTRYGCKELLRTLPFQQRDKLNPAKLADGEDHWTVALAYFCMGMAPASRPNTESEVKPWMRPRQRRRMLAA